MLGDRLRELRERRDIKQVQISAYLEIGQNTYSRWENNERKPDYETLIKIAEYYNVSIDYLLEHKLKDEPMIRLNNVLSDEQKESLITICKTIYPNECKKIDL